MLPSGATTAASTESGPGAATSRRWGAAQERAFRAELALVASQRVIQRFESQQQASQQTLRAIRNSPWWLATAPVRVPLSRLRNRSAQRTTPPAPASAPAITQVRESPVVSDYCARRTESLQVRIRQILAEYHDAEPDENSLAQQFVLLAQLVDRDDSSQLLWVLHTAFTSSLPTITEVDLLAARRDIGRGPAVISSLRRSSTEQPETWAATAPMELIREPVIEVTNTASHKFHTGIERVARTTIPLWLADHAAQLAVFDSATKTLRPPGPVESNRVLRWGEATPVASAAAKPDRILVPWRTTVVLPELAGMPERAARLAAVAACSGNDLSAIVFDLIPYSLPDSVAGDLPRRFGNYMSAIRRGARLSAISQSVADDFSGFSAAFTNQGVATPQIHADLLPFEAGQVNEQSLEAHRDEVLGDSRLPLVLSVSSIEPRKNHLRTLQAAERLWREGLEFQLLFIAGRGWKREAFDTEFAGLAARGRPVRLISSASEELLWSAYHLAAFSVFISTAEGFGLPAAESIAAGTPVVLSRNGSMGEIGAGGGAIMVDPHDVDDITSAMRCLLTDDARLRTLADQARARVLPTWSDYADKTWRWLADGDR